jgi:mannose-1-phosphate guanylyltransferase / mannose-6-phosphate isomerase
MLVLPVDDVIKKNGAFRLAVERAAALVQQGPLATFGIVPSAPETGYGYIRRSKPLPGCDDCYQIDHFVETPDSKMAEGFAADGGYYWNSGMFLFRAERFLAEVERHAPTIAHATESAIQNAYRDLDFCRLDEAAFTASPSDSIDYAVMEHTRDGIGVSADIGWSGVGSWSALAEALVGDDYDNVKRGDVYLDRTSNTLVRAESRIVAVIGVKVLVVVETNDSVLVAHKDQLQRVKNVVEYLKVQERRERLDHTKVSVGLLRRHRRR